MNTDCYTRQEKIIHNKFRWRIARDNFSICEEPLYYEAWAWTYAYLRHLNKPISNWLKTNAESEYTYIGDCVKMIKSGETRGRIHFDEIHNYIKNLRGAKAKLRYYGFE